MSTVVCLLSVLLYVYVNIQSSQFPSSNIQRTSRFPVSICSLIGDEIYFSSAEQMKKIFNSRLLEH